VGLTPDGSALDKLDEDQSGLIRQKISNITMLYTEHLKIQA
jgi:hypothetical protein